jgi:outer membrane protein, multidrug efflux system
MAVNLNARRRVAALRASVRAAARNVEDALAARQSAEQRAVTSGLAVEARRITLRAKEASWRAGSIAVFKLEDARRQFNAAQESSIAATRDRAQAWVDLVLAPGGQLNVRTPIANGANSFPGKQPG